MADQPPAPVFDPQKMRSVQSTNPINDTVLGVLQGVGYCFAQNSIFISDRLNHGRVYRLFYSPGLLEEYSWWLHTYSFSDEIKQNNELRTVAHYIQNKEDAKRLKKEQNGKTTMNLAAEKENFRALDKAVQKLERMILSRGFGSSKIKHISNYNYLACTDAAPFELACFVIKSAWISNTHFYDTLCKTPEVFDSKKASSPSTVSIRPCYNRQCGSSKGVVTAVSEQYKEAVGLVRAFDPPNRDALFAAASV